jgi:cytochrome c oxidase cbb3-type subunit 3
VEASLTKAAVILTCCGFALLAQNTPPANRGRGGAPARARRTFDPAVVDRGKTLYSPACGFCHGVDARGGAGGPDLARSLAVLSDDNGVGIGELLRAGRVEKGMPAFPNFTQQQISDIATFLHDRVEVARTRVVTPDTRVVVGDPRSGAAYFNGSGRCNACHSVTGDLKGIGAKYDPVSLQDRFVNPRGPTTGGEPIPKTVKVTLQSGETASGTLLYISEFAVTLRDSAGERRTLSRIGDMPRVEVTDPLQAHLDLLMKYTDMDIHNVTAYLVSLK